MTSESSKHVNLGHLIKEAKIRNIARLAKMLVDLYGIDEQFEGLEKREGQHVIIYLKELDGYLNFTLTAKRKNFNCKIEPSQDPKAKIIIKTREANILKVLSNIIRSKSNISGILKVGKLVLTGKVKIKGSYGASISLLKCLLIGKNEIYKNVDKVISNKIK